MTARRTPKRYRGYGPSLDHGPTRVELEEEFDMPGLSLEQVRERFFLPVRFERHKEP